ncbi:hypothetical protein MRB53_039309 [Persea americana]|nr:hypothetical protein MRB53_039309 [Persea americana]
MIFASASCASARGPVEVQTCGGSSRSLAGRTRYSLESGRVQSSRRTTVFEANYTLVAIPDSRLCSRLNRCVSHRHASRPHRSSLVTGRALASRKALWSRETFVVASRKLGRPYVRFASGAVLCGGILRASECSGEVTMSSIDVLDNVPNKSSTMSDDDLRDRHIGEGESAHA